MPPYAPHCCKPKDDLLDLFDLLSQIPPTYVEADPGRAFGIKTSAYPLLKLTPSLISIMASEK